MPETADIDLGVFCVGSTDRIRFTVTRDGAAWDLTAATVTLVLEKPDRVTQVTKTMTVEDGPGGVVYYDTLAADLDQAGWWTANVRVAAGAVTKRYPFEIGFTVTDQP